jgi:hypothetical protein
VSDQQIHPLWWTECPTLALQCDAAVHRCSLCQQFGHYLVDCPDRVEFKPWPILPPPRPAIVDMSIPPIVVISFWTFVGFSAGFALAYLVMGWRI